MQSNLTINSAMPAKDRISLKLTILFIAAFLLFLLGNLVYGTFIQVVETAVSEENAKAEPALALDPKIEKELANVTAPDSIPSAADVQDPFKDRGGISSNGQAQANSALTAARAASQQSPVAAAPAAKKLLAGQMPSENSNPQGRSNNFPPPGTTVIPATVVTTPTSIRFQAREASLRAGQSVEPESSVFAVEDLLPVGVVSGGDGEPEVMLYSQSLMRTFSFAPGARFFDGWLASWTAEGVEFGYAEARGEVRLKTWARSVKANTSQSSLTADRTNGN